MPVVFIPPPLQALTGGRASIQVQGATVGELLDHLEQLWPGLRERLVEGDRLRTHVRVAVDGRISALGLLERVSASSEVRFVAAVDGP